MVDLFEFVVVVRFLKFVFVLDKEVVGDYFGEFVVFIIMVLDEYIKFFDFRDVTFDRVLRFFLFGFKFFGEV